jgi:hypothetical protein
MELNRTDTIKVVPISIESLLAMVATPCAASAWESASCTCDQPTVVNLRAMARNDTR